MSFKVKLKYSILKKIKEIANLLEIVYSIQYISTIVPPASLGIAKISKLVNTRTTEKLLGSAWFCVGWHTDTKLNAVFN